MNDGEERQRIIDWIERAMAFAQMSQAVLAKAVWPNDRSILGKILKNKRRAQVGELAQIAACTKYPAYLSGFPSEPKRDPAPKPSREFHVREHRLAAKTKESEMAAALGLDVDIYQAMERRPYNFSDDQLRVIATYLGIGFDSLRFPPPKTAEVKVPSNRVTKLGARAISISKRQKS